MTIQKPNPFEKQLALNTVFREIWWPHIDITRILHSRTEADFPTIKKLVELPGFIHFHTLLRKAIDLDNQYIDRIEFREDGSCAVTIKYNWIFVSPSQVIERYKAPRVITFNDNQILKDDIGDMPLWKPQPKYNDSPRQSQGGIDSIADIGRNIPDAATLINRRIARWI